MKLQEIELPLHKRKNVLEENLSIFDNTNSNNNHNSGISKLIDKCINSRSTLITSKDDKDDDSLFINDDDGDAGLIVTSIGRGGSVKDRSAVYFKPPREDILSYNDEYNDDGEYEHGGDSYGVGISGTSSEINEDSSSNEFPRRVKSFVYRNVLNVDISQDTPDLASYAISATTTRPPHVNYPSDIPGSENINKFNNDENHVFIPDIRYGTTGDFVGSAPVGAGRWSTLKRKKNNCYKNNSTIINNNDTEDDNVDGLSPSSSFTIASANEIKNSLENNLQQQQQQQTALLRSKDITQSKNITDEDKLNTNKKSNNSSTIVTSPVIMPQNDHEFLSQSPTPLREPIIASTNNKNHSENPEIQPFDVMKNVTGLSQQDTHYNSSKSHENIDILLSPIVEESNPFFSPKKDKNPEIPIGLIKHNHSREPSTSLQSLFVDSNSENNSDISIKSSISKKEESSPVDNTCKMERTNENNKTKPITILSKDFLLAVRKSWNSEFTDAFKIFSQHKKRLSRWSVADVEMQLIKHLMTGQTSDNENPELINTLFETEKLATKINDNKEEFENSFSYLRTEIWKKTLNPNSTPADDEAIFVSLRTNYRWDCELAMADILLFRAVLQVVGGSEIKGAFNLRKAWKTYSKVRDEIERIKGESIASKKELNKVESSSSNSSRWSFGSAFISGQGSLTNMVGLGTSKNHTPEASIATLDGINNSIEVDSDVEDCLEFGIGVFYFIVSIVPGSFLSVLKAIGFNVDREKGITMLENCFSRNGVRAPFAALFLLVNYLFLPRGIIDANISLNRAGLIIEECIKKYPNSPPFLFMACQHARKTGRIKEAINFINIGIKSCENAEATSTNYRFELGITYLVNMDFSTAKDIFELLFYGNTIVFTGSKGSIRLQGSIHGSARIRSKDGGVGNNNCKNSTKKKDNKTTLLQLFEFELRPFCGLCLAGCYFMVKLEDYALKEAIDVLKQTKAMTNPPSDDNNSSSVAGSIGLFGTNGSGFGGFSGIGELKKRWANMLNKIWNDLKKPTDTDTCAVYLLFRGVFEKYLENDPLIAQATFFECLTMEVGVVTETWVIPHCRYELGELFYKQIDNQEAATEQFKWILKGSRPTSRGVLIPRRDNNLSLVSLTSKSSFDLTTSTTSISISTNPDKFKKYEFSRTLKQRCTVVVDQIKSGTLLTPSSTNVQNNSNGDGSNNKSFHNRKKSGSSSGLLKEIYEQQLLQKVISSPTTILKSSSNNDDDSNYIKDNRNISKKNTDNNNDKIINETDISSKIISTSVFKKRHKQRSLSLPQHEIETARDIIISSNSGKNNSSGSEGKAKSKFSLVFKLK
nr:12538_t:CDS:10 [Entrophospora candida]CAG8593458.1 5666_t:CDS:10 [Entrophospora candida]